jgi:hypothetical protein
VPARGALDGASTALCSRWRRFSTVYRALDSG